MPRAGLRDDDRGLALVEFAIILPFLVLLYLGGYVLTDKVARSRKITIAARALADMVAQSATGTTTANELDNELAATTQVLTPYPVAQSAMRVTEVYTDSTLKTTVKWSRGLRTAAYTPNALFTLPAALKVAGTYLLIGEVTYAYTPPVAFGIVQPGTLADRIIMLPRNTSSIDCGDC